MTLPSHTHKHTHITIKPYLDYYMNRFLGLSVWAYFAFNEGSLLGDPDTFMRVTTMVLFFTATLPELLTPSTMLTIESELSCVYVRMYADDRK